MQRFRHPDYAPPAQYNDVALLQLDRPIEFTDYVRPACLQTNADLSGTEPIATGWGTTEFGGATSDILQKVTLQYFSNDQCRANFQPQTRLVNGIDENSQLCAGGVTESKDTCQVSFSEL